MLRRHLVAMRGSRPCSGRDGPHEAPHLSLQSPGVLREFWVVRRRNPFPHAPELIGKGLQGLLLIQPTALQPKGFILDQAVTGPHHARRGRLARADQKPCCHEKNGTPPPVGVFFSRGGGVTPPPPPTFHLP